VANDLDPPAHLPRYTTLDDLSLADLECVRLILRGGSVIDWHRLNFASGDDIEQFMRSQEMDPSNPEDLQRSEAIRNASISYLRRNFEFPIPKPVAEASLADLIALAAGKGHRQLCACTILKVMHIIHHLEARELLYLLPVSDQEVFQLVEHKVYRVIGSMLAQGLPILEFIGGRKNKDSLYTKLLSKEETIAAQIYDKLRFRIVTRTMDDVFPVLNYLIKTLFPFNYVIPRQSQNTLFNFRKYCTANPKLKPMLERLQISPDYEERTGWIDNRFTASTYKIVHFVTDMPVRLPREMLEEAPPAARSLGPLIFVQTEFQIIDRDSEQSNEMGEASHAAYKHRQKLAVMRRLKVGYEEPRPRPRAPTRSLKAPRRKKRS
jgi:uncharacterized protein (TIGR04552 family)